MYTLDLSGHDETGKPGVERFGGLFLTIEAAEAYGKVAAKSGRFVFQPAMIWVRDQENTVVRQTTI